MPDDVSSTPPDESPGESPDEAPGGEQPDGLPDEHEQEDDHGHAAGAGDAPRGPGALIEVTDLPRPPAPPRRTGIFLDPDDLREHVGGLLRVMLGGYQVDVFGNYTFTHEGARIFVTVGGSPIGPQVGVFSVTNIDLDLSPELARFIATTNHQLGFGSLSYDPQSRTVWIRHTLLGTMLDAPELQAAVAAIASTAAAIDDHIADTFGGRRFEDAPTDIQEATRPPETSQQPYSPSSGYL